jgi:hypothetical protein
MNITTEEIVGTLKIIQNSELRGMKKLKKSEALQVWHGQALAELY